MIVQEHMAKTKWCPMIRVANGTQATNVAVNLSGVLDSNTNQSGKCQATDCMMWRPVDHNKGAPGYCGLGGRP